MAGKPHHDLTYGQDLAMMAYDESVKLAEHLADDFVQGMNAIVSRVGQYFSPDDDF